MEEVHIEKDDRASAPSLTCTVAPSTGHMYSVGDERRAAEMEELYTTHSVPISAKTDELLMAARRRQLTYVWSV
jgi:predicted P-loop ATPase/GTPase